MNQESLLLTKGVIRELKHDILSGRLPVNTRLPSERELAERFSVSRITVRAAIGKLAHLGLVRTLPQSGTFVNDYWNEASLDLLIDIVSSNEPVESEVLVSILDLRRIAEVYAVERAVPQMNKEDRARLRAIVDSLGKDSITCDEIVPLDYELHTLFVRKAGNRVIQLIYNSCRPIYIFYLNFFYSDTAHYEKMLPRYQKLVHAVDLGDYEYAAHIMRDLLVYAENAVKSALEGVESVRIPTEG